MSKRVFELKKVDKNADQRVLDQYRAAITNMVTFEEKGITKYKLDCFETTSSFFIASEKKDQTIREVINANFPDAHCSLQFARMLILAVA